MSIWKMVGRLILFSPRLYLAAFVLWALVHGLPLVTGVILKHIFDALSGQAGIDGSIGMLVSFLVITLLVRSIALIAGFFADFSFIFMVTALLRKNMLTNLLKRPAAKAIPKSVGDAISRFRDDLDEIGGFCGWTADLIYRPLFVVAALVIMMQISVKLTLIVMIPLALLLILSNLAKKRVEEYRRKSRDATGLATGFISDMFTAVETIKANGSEKHVADHLKRLNECRQRLSVKDKVFSELLNTVFSNSIYLGTGLILMFAARSMQEGSFTVGDLALFIFYLGWLGEVTHFLGRLMARFKQAQVSFDRSIELQGGDASELVEHGPLYMTPPYSSVESVVYQQSEPFEILDVTGLSYRHDDTQPGIHDIDLRIHREELVVITGEVGSGKTTLIRTLLGLLPKQQGTICWNGKVVQNPSEYFIPPRSAYTPQVPHLFNETWKDNILMGLPEDQVDLAQALRTVSLDNDLATGGHTLETELGSQGAKLSGGQQQRTAAARMFVRKAELLVMDDISSAVDVKTESEMWEQIRSMHQVTCLIVSNKASILQAADQIIVLKEGRIEAKGGLKEVIQHSAYVREILNEK